MTVITHPNLYFELDGTPSHTPAWRMFNTLELLKPARLRGTAPVVIPTATGARAMPLRAAATERAVAGRVYGGFDIDGNPTSSEIEGLITNLESLTDLWATVPVTADSTRTLVLHAYGVTYSGSVQVIDMDWDYEQMPICANVIFRLLLPVGALAEVVSA
jgi:hypothetical protein